MIFAKPTKYGAGLHLYGDYYDLDGLHETIHNLTDKHPLLGDLEDFVLGLAYEIRHAYQGDREKVYLGHTDADRVSYYGVAILWPIFLAQVRLLRWAAGFQTVSRQCHSDLFRLEYCAEKALVDYDPFIGKRCFEWLNSFSGFSSDYLVDFISDSALRYISERGVGKARFKRLPEILLTLSPLSDEYCEFEEEVDRAAKENQCSPRDLRSTSEWPDFKW